MPPESQATKWRKGCPARGNPSRSTDRPGPSTADESITDDARVNSPSKRARHPSVKRHVSKRLASLRAGQMDRAVRAVLETILDLAGPDGTCDPSLAEIATTAKLSVRTAQFALRALETHGWIATVFRKESARWNHTNLYRLLPGGRPWNETRTCKSFKKPTLADPWGELDRARPCPSSTPPGAGPGTPEVHAEVPGEGAAVGPLPAPGEACEAVPEDGGEDGSVPARATKPSPGPRVEVDDLTEIMGESAPSLPVLRPQPFAHEARVRAALIAADLDIGEGTGFERKIVRIAHRRGIGMTDFTTMIHAIGQKRREKLFDAAGAPTPWDTTDGARAYVYRALCNNPVPKPLPLYEPQPFRERPLYEAMERDHRREMPTEPRPSSDAARQVQEALAATYHGHQPLLPLANERFATRFAQHARETACGGRFHLADLLAVIRHSATMMSFKLKRNELLPLGGLESWLMRDLRTQQPGCAAALNERVSKARFYEPRQRVDTRQPGTLEHLRRPVVELSEEETRRLAEDIFGPRKGT